MILFLSCALYTVNNDDQYCGCLKLLNWRESGHVGDMVSKLVNSLVGWLLWKLGPKGTFKLLKIRNGVCYLLSKAMTRLLYMEFLLGIRKKLQVVLKHWIKRFKNRLDMVHLQCQGNKSSVSQCQRPQFYFRKIKISLWGLQGQMNLFGWILILWVEWQGFGLQSSHDGAVGRACLLWSGLLYELGRFPSEAILAVSFSVHVTLVI